MTLNDWSASLTGIAPALGNHLWQSTIFLIAAGLLTLSLRKNPARARYWLWLTASVKFLIPFSLLITVGSHLWNGSARTNAGFYHAIDAVGQPFPLPLIPETSGAYPSTVLPRATPVVPILFAVWLCGFLVVAFLWLVRWRRISATVRKAAPLPEGREVEALRRLAAMGGLRKEIQVLLSRASLEPGIFGITRPVLLWPEGLSDWLDDAHLEAILAHELWHVRRRDNLAASMHMLVEAVFWFHPLVWWLGARLVEERERACDEEVLEMGSERQVYAESILKICEFCVESPLACVSGVTGSDLKKRMVYIMTRSVSRKLDFGRKLLLSVAGFAAVVVPIAFGLVRPTKGQAEAQTQDTLPPVPAFESAMIRPNNGEPMDGFTIVGKPFKAMMWKGDRLMATNFTLHGLIRVAYDLQDDQILAGQDWVNTEGYDLDVKVGKSGMDELQKLGPHYRLNGRTLIFQKLLSDRFKLSFHRETRDLPVYVLAVSANGPKVQPAKPGDTYINGFKNPDGSAIGPGIWEPGPCQIVGQGVPLAALVGVLSDELRRTVVDKTNLKANYDFTLDCHEAFMSRGESLLTVLPEQLGLELKSQTAPVEVLVIDHAEKIASDRPSKSQSSRRSSSSPVLSSSVTPHQVEAPSQPQEIANSPKYEIVSIKPDNTGSDQSKLLGSPEGITATNVSLRELIGATYGVQDDQILGAPKWVNSENYDVEAKMDTSVADELRKLGADQGNLERQRMLQALLADRFKLVLHRETKEVSGYALVIAKSGPKLREAKPGDTYPDGLKDPHGRPLGAGFLIRPGTVPGPEPCQLIGQGVPIADLAGVLSARLGRNVVDETGLKGNYDFKIDCQKAFMELGGSVWTFLLEQLGLDLKSQTAPVEVLVIDHAEKPSAD